jgi:hypothetical protein
MQNILDFIHYLLSYLQFGSGGRNHPIGFVILITTYFLSISIYEKYRILYKEVGANDHLSGDEEYRLLKNCFWGRLIFGISFLLLSGRILFLLVPKFYN